MRNVVLASIAAALPPSISPFLRPLLSELHGDSAPAPPTGDEDEDNSSDEVGKHFSRSKPSSFSGSNYYSSSSSSSSRFEGYDND